jgi:LPS-assembly lipoprotein
MGRIREGGMSLVLKDLLLFTWLAACGTGIVIAAAIFLTRRKLCCPAISLWWWHDKGMAAPSPWNEGRGKGAPPPGAVWHGTTMRTAAALSIAALAAGCFQPLYGEQSVTGGPVLRDQLSAVDVLQIEALKGTDEARIAVEIRNALLYDFTGGGYAAPPTHRLKIAMRSTRSAIIVDVHTSRPDIENYGIDATYSLTEIGTGNVVVTGQTFARVSYDIPGQEQRFARVRGLRDAESRAAKVIADNIRSRLASYFIAGT